jgi:hypothetical protein
MIAKVISLQNNVRTPKQDDILQYKPQNLRGINKISLLSRTAAYISFISDNE